METKNLQGRAIDTPSKERVLSKERKHPCFIASCYYTVVKMEGRIHYSLVALTHTLYERVGEGGRYQTQQDVGIGRGRQYTVSALTLNVREERRLME